MEIRSDRRYRFDHDRATVWTALTQVEHYPMWWPWLREFDGSSFAEGDRWSCIVKPPLPYSLTFHITLVDVVETEDVRATLDGDLVGRARLSLDDRPGGCELRLESTLEATSGPASVMARFASPIAEFGHNWILDTGLKQFRAKALTAADRPGY